MTQVTARVNFNELDAAMEGFVLVPGSEAYDERRKIWNGMIDRQPAAFAVVKSTGDVAKSVCFARDHGLALSVCGGGHNVAGNALVDNGLVVDMRELPGR